jgi:outer membrane protein assembly factor BamB
VVPGDVLSFRGGPARTGVMPGPGPTSRPTLLWSVPTGVIGVPPAVKDGIAYVGDASGELHAFDLATGVDRWPAARRQQGGALWAVTIDEDTLYVHSSDHVVHAIDLATYTERWRFPDGSDRDIPLVLGDGVYVGVEGALVALDKATGAERWRVAVTGSAAYTAGADGVAYVGGNNDGGLSAIDLVSHRQLWRFETHANNLLAPSVVGDTVYVVAQDDPGRNSGLFAIDAKTGAERWHYRAPGAEDLVGLAVGDRFVYVGAYTPTSKILAVDRATGQLAWAADSGDTVPRPGIAGDVLYATAHGRLFTLDAATGVAGWTVPIVGYGAGTTVTGGMVLVPCCYDSEQPGSLSAYVAPDDARLASLQQTRTSAPSATARPEIARTVASYQYDERPALWLSVALDPAGDIYVADMANDRIVEFAPDGKPLHSFGSTGAGPGQFNFDEVTSFDQSTSVAVSTDGTIAVGDGANHRVQIFDRNFKFIRMWGSFGRRAGQFVNACCVAWGVSGQLLVADPGRDDVQVFSPEGQLLRVIGMQGSKPGQFLRPGVPAVDAAGNIYVPDFDNRRIQKLDASGAYLMSFGNDPNKGPIIAEGNSVVLDASGRVYVGDGANRLSIFAPDGTLLGYGGAWTLDGLTFGGIHALGPHGRFYVAWTGDPTKDPGRLEVLQLLPPFDE